MKNLIKTDFDLVFEKLSKLYEDVPQHRQAKYMSKMLADFEAKAKELVLKYGCKWQDSRIYSNDYNWAAYIDISSISNDQIKYNNLIAEINKLAEDSGIDEIKIKKLDNKPNTLRLIVAADAVIDNTWTAQDLEDYFIPDVNDEKRIAARAKLDEIESRMFKRANDTRDTETRWADYKFAKDYENVITNKETVLNGIPSISLEHPNTKFSLIADRKSDFKGSIKIPEDVIKKLTGGQADRTDCKIEGKAGWFKGYSGPCSKAFARYFLDKESNGGFGSLHNTDYVLFVNKEDNKIICVNVNDPMINWEVGTLPAEYKYPLEKKTQAAESLD